jgi:ABC-2 type transport system ATP-binding protein
MRQRLGLAAALLRRPRLLVIDEPTSALDPAGAAEIRAMTRRLADEGAAVVLSSHNMAEIEALCGSVTILDRGGVIFSGPIEALRERAPAPTYVLRTSDDRAAIRHGAGRPGLTIVPLDAGGFELSAHADALDAYVIALGASGIAVRVLQPQTRSLESLFLQLTATPAAS